MSPAAPTPPTEANRRAMSSGASEQLAIFVGDRAPIQSTLLTKFA